MSTVIYLTENLKEFIANMSEEEYNFEPDGTFHCSSWNKGIPCSEETKKAMSAWQKGKPKSKAHNRNVSEAKKGKKQSEAHKANHRASMIANGHWSK